MAPIGRETLDGMSCAKPGCDHSTHEGLWLHSKCHPPAPTWCYYKDGILTITCAECEKPIAAIVVGTVMGEGEFQ